MSKKNLLVLLVSVFALAALSAQFVSAADQFGQITRVEVNGEDITSLSGLTFFAGERVAVTVTFRADSTAEDAQVELWISGEDHFESTRFDALAGHSYTNKWKIKLAPETMGKVNVFGSLEEISNLVKETGCSFCIDFAHILARDKVVDYKRVEKLFPQKEWHVHFSGIVYGEKGEKHHKTTEKKEWEELLKNLPKDKKIRIINESPTLVEDSVEGLKIYNNLATH